MRARHDVGGERPALLDGVWRALVEAARADDELERLRIELEGRRRDEVSSSLERILGRTIDGRILDLLWAIFGTEVYAKLVIDAHMSRADYEACMIDALTGLTATS